MALWTSMGHAMRRRMGAPSSHLEAAGKSMDKSIPTTADILASAEHAASPRRYMGMDMAKVAPSAPSRGTKMPKKNTQAADPTAGGKANRSNVIAGDAAASERMGARYRLSVKFPAGHEPASSATMRNAKTVRSIQGRQAANFNDGNSASY
jgi:hypothetical protein